MSQAMIHIHPEIWQSIGKPDVAHARQALLLPDEYEAKEISNNGNFITLLVSSPSIPNGVSMMKPHYSVEYEGNGNKLDQTTTFEYMEMW